MPRGRPGRALARAAGLEQRGDAATTVRGEPASISLLWNAYGCRVPRPDQAVHRQRRGLFERTPHECGKSVVAAHELLIGSKLPQGFGESLNMAD